MNRCYIRVLYSYTEWQTVSKAILARLVIIIVLINFIFLLRVFFYQFSNFTKRPFPQWAAGFLFMYKTLFWKYRKRFVPFIVEWSKLNAMNCSSSYAQIQTWVCEKSSMYYVSNYCGGSPNIRLKPWRMVLGLKESYFGAFWCEVRLLS